MSQIAGEASFTENLPGGFQSTFLEPDRLRNLARANPGQSLGETVDEYSVSGTQSTLTENDIIASTADRVLTQFLTPERTLEFPGLALALNDENGPSLLEQFAAKYKEDNDTPSGTIKDAARAGTDDILFSFATPEVYSEIANGDLSGPDTFEQPNLTSGDTLELVGDSGIDETGSSNGSSLSLDDDEYLFFTGDFVDLSEGKSAVTATQLTDVDGEDFGPVNGIFSQRASGAHILTTQGTYATATIDIDAKVYADGDAEIVPIAFYMAPGRKAPALV